MNRANFQAIEKNGKKNFLVKTYIEKTGQNFIVLKCSHILLVKFTWAMLEITQLEM